MTTDRDRGFAEGVEAAAKVCERYVTGYRKAASEDASGKSYENRCNEAADVLDFAATAIRQLAARPGVVEDDLTALLAEAKRKVDAMSPVEREAMYKAQRESWGRSCDGWDEGTVQVNAAAPSGSGDES